MRALNESKFRFTTHPYRSTATRAQCSERPYTRATPTIPKPLHHIYLAAKKAAKVNSKTISEIFQLQNHSTNLNSQEEAAIDTP
jgi:hypothetical protein